MRDVPENPMWQPADEVPAPGPVPAHLARVQGPFAPVDPLAAPLADRSVRAQPLPHFGEQPWQPTSRLQPRVDPLPAPVSRQAGRFWTTGKVVGLILCVVVLGAVGLLVGTVALFQHSQRAAVATTTGIAIRTELANAGTAMELVAAERGAYPTSIAELAASGYRPNPDVEVSVVSVRGEGPDATYCLAGAAPGESPSEWFRPGIGLSTVPCG